MKNRINQLKGAASTALIAGSMSILGGAAMADQQILDDLIVDGSICVGQDCVNGESFGFDTLRLKENNLRIRFQDTSASASFPSNDWEITANDSSNGGDNYLAIKDIDTGRIPFRVEAGAQSNNLVVESDGDVGIKTLNPAVDLHIVEGNTPTVRLEQDGSDGFTPQTWDVAGNEANFFIRDVTNGSKLSFRIRPGAPESSIDIANDGDVGIGTSSPQAKLHTVGTGTQQALFESSNGGAVQVRLKTNSTNRRFLALDGSNVVRSQILFNDNDIQFLGQTGANLWVTFSAAGIVTSGAGACNPGPCDLTFDPEAYKVESIEAHSEYMWTNKHLWGVGPTIEGEPINLTKKTTGILHELEKAHIYIEQLHVRLKETEKLKERIAKLEQRF